MMLLYGHMQEPLPASAFLFTRRQRFKPYVSITAV